MKSKLLQDGCNKHQGIVNDFDKNVAASYGLEVENTFSKFLLQINQNKS
jgi:hypothetical protein